ncbi:c-type cytochrome [Mangrovicella endophytica]|uniref:c-type cytochrome n=1 Tax=Mangrovicella endophytica TaxID=2066697 RepID=UPI001FE0CC02|nr:c-type cytochrome [Mangrovicella endophytica]
MTSRLLGLAGAFLLTSTCLTVAQDNAPAAAGTTIVPQGAAAPAAPAAGTAAPAADSAAPAGQAGAPVAAEAPAVDGAAAPADAAASGEVAMAEGPGAKIDASPSADTKKEGNKATEGDEGKFVDPAGNPVYNLSADGTADWYAWRGFKKYGANCLQCHGPDGLGSSFAPNLTEELQNIDYFTFAGIVVNGQQNKWNPSGNSVMPAWGEDPNVMCSLDAIYIYLRGRADGVLGRGEPKRPPKNEAGQKAEYDCLGF